MPLSAKIRPRVPCDQESAEAGVMLILAAEFVEEGKKIEMHLSEDTLYRLFNELYF